MRCPKCGTTVRDGESICPVCGAKTDYAPVRPEHSSDHQKKPNRFVQILAGCLAGVMVLTAGVSGFIYVRSRSKDARLERQLKRAANYLEAEQYEEAEVAYNEALRIDSESNEAALGLAEVYNAQDKPEEADRMLQRVDQRIQYLAEADIPDSERRALEDQKEQYDRVADRTADMFASNGEPEVAENLNNRKKNTDDRYRYIIDDPGVDLKPDPVDPGPVVYGVTPVVDKSKGTTESPYGGIDDADDVGTADPTVPSEIETETETENTTESVVPPVTAAPEHEEPENPIVTTEYDIAVTTEFETAATTESEVVATTEPDAAAVTEPETAVTTELEAVATTEPDVAAVTEPVTVVTTETAPAATTEYASVVTTEEPTGPRVIMDTPLTEDPEDDLISDDDQMTGEDDISDEDQIPAEDGITEEDHTSDEYPEDPEEPDKDHASDEYSEDPEEPDEDHISDEDPEDPDEPGKEEREEETTSEDPEHAKRDIPQEDAETIGTPEKRDKGAHTGDEEHTENPADDPSGTEEPPTPTEGPVEEPLTPTEAPVDEPLTPAEEPVDEPSVPTEEPVDEPPVPVEEPVDEPPVPVEEPVDEPYIPAEEPVEEPSEPAEDPWDEFPVSAEEPEPELPEPVEEPWEELPESVMEYIPEEVYDAVEPALESVEPLVQAMAMEYEDSADISSDYPGADDFWEIAENFAQIRGGSCSAYELNEAAYAMFPDYPGVLPEVPRSMTDSGKIAENGGSYSFGSGTTGGSLVLQSSTVSEDGTVEATYMYTGTDGATLTISVRLTENPKSDGASGSIFKYRIQSIQIK